MEDQEEDEFLKKCLVIEPLTLEEEYISLPGHIAYWNSKYAEAYQRWLQMKTERELLHNHLYLVERDRLTTKPGGGKVTISEVESHVLNHPELQQVKADEIVAETRKVKLAGVMDALRTKREMLISLGAHIRMEMGNDPIVRQQRSVDREIRQNRG